jgi:hypothetical protein
MEKLEIPFVLAEEGVLVHMLCLVCCVLRIGLPREGEKTLEELKTRKTSRRGKEGM